MRVIDSRRVTGPNIAARTPGVVVEVALDGADPNVVIAAWRAAIARVWPWPAEPHVRHSTNSLALFVPGPVDALLPLTDLNEHAVACAEAVLAGAPLPPLDPAVLAAVTAAHVPGLAELIAAARAHDALLLVDEVAITLGTGRSLRTFPRMGPVPAPDAIDWAAIAASRFPIAMITGTNGKTTTARLVARIARTAGRTPGLTSSDGLVVGDHVLERGDFSGPEGARTVLRHPEVDLAVLETARGGILRRGLTVEHCDAAAITNVSADHLGDYGVDDVATMARVKAVVAGAARRVVLNAEDAQLVALAPGLGAEVTWFGGDGRRGEHAWFVRDGQIMARDARGERTLLAIADVPIAFGGRAPYNVANALAAAALAHALELPDTAIVTGLRDFTSSATDNPGRGNLALVNGVQVLLDFGHNAAAVTGVIGLAQGLAAGGALRVTIGMPGDRNDAELAEVARAIAHGAPAEVIVRELGDTFLRGRAPGATSAVLAAELAGAGVTVSHATDELTAVARALAASRPGDLVLVLVHLDPAVDAYLASTAR